MAGNLYDVITTIIAGGLLGTLGQGIRMAVGLKKLSDTNRASGGAETDINGARLLLSLFIGFVAGALFLLIKDDTEINKELLFTVIAAGYSGADFIEGFFNTYVAKIGNTNSPSPQGNITPGLVPNDSNPTSFSGDEREDEPTTNL
jgi:hypothetical protein